ncbi:hypothetical protein C448_10582 [Halococcus morrhuae DSM 1307]|uniref:Uncharacterized protein n=2 Tax=Halococcus morrhuae TaxID=2250 RepID=M0M9V2_HALMO|nr:hypothetical protein C448_10582 [Halococcus morrhuae DSM 1307]
MFPQLSFGRIMATDGPDSRDRYLTKRNFARFYKWLTILGVAAAVATVVAGEIILNAITGTIIGCWLLASLFVFAHFGIKNSTHGI